MAYARRALDSFSALGDPTRRAIFERIALRPSAVGELARGLPVSRPAVSQHLRALKKAGLVQETAQGTRHIYRVDPRGIAAMRDWLDALWTPALGAFKDFADQQTDEEDSGMSIAPIVHKVEVKAPRSRAFDLFATRMGEWWPKGKTIGKAEHAAIIIEAHSGGRWLERDAAGNETRWGTVLAWEPPARLLLGWQINSEWGYDPGLLTEVEVTFAPADNGGTLVTLEHRNLERFGADAERHAERLRGGWPTMVGGFARYADAQTSPAQ
jgi:DNA-binding transcriptional ArsR family regulator/uncharacterized protein YndB with AHSA1/START domain